jgi:hypothetical protein
MRNENIKMDLGFWIELRNPKSTIGKEEGKNEKKFDYSFVNGIDHDSILRRCPRKGSNCS